MYVGGSVYALAFIHLVFLHTGHNECLQKPRSSSPYAGEDMLKRGVGPEHQGGVEWGGMGWMYTCSIDENPLHEKGHK